MADLDIGGRVYVGQHLPALRTARPDNCLIDPRLPVAKGQPDRDGTLMPYWPSYAEIPPACRLAYLQWLAGGRKDPQAGIGYVFLYFYGLERRLFVDRPPRDEISCLIDEVERLRSLYGANASFQRFSAALLEAAGLLAPDGKEIEPVFEAGQWELPLRVKLGLGQQIAAGNRLSADWMLSWWYCHPDTRLRTAATRALAEFRLLFRVYFLEAFPDGLKVAKPKRTLRFVYRAASNSFERSFARELQTIPDVSKLTAPLAKVAPIAARCIDELDAFSRFLGRRPDGRGTLAAHALLPPVLAGLLPNPELGKLSVWVDSILAEANGLVPLAEVLERLEGRKAEKAGRRAITGAADALARLRIGMAPDPRFALRAPKLTEPVVLFRLPKAIDRLDEVGPAYAGILLTLSLGAIVAHADGEVSEAERDHLMALVDMGTDLSDSDRARLRANVLWLSVCAPSLTQLRKAIGSVSAETRHMIGKTAIAVAGADGVIDAREIRTLQKLYGVLELDESSLFSDLHAIAGAAVQEPVVMRRASTAPTGFTIPKPPAPAPLPAADAGEPGLALDQQRIGEIMQSTARVSRTLAEVFAADEPEDLEAGEPPADSETTLLDASMASLEPSVRVMLQELLTRPHWTYDAFDQLAKHFDLMAEGTKETINEWSFSLFGDALLEEDEVIEVNPAVLVQMQRQASEPRHAAA